MTVNTNAAGATYAQRTGGRGTTGVNNQTLAGPITLTLSEPLGVNPATAAYVQRLDPDGVDRNVDLPDSADAITTGSAFQIENGGTTGTLILRDGGGATIGTVTVGNSALLAAGTGGWTFTSVVGSNVPGVCYDPSATGTPLADALAKINQAACPVDLIVDWANTPIPGPDPTTHVATVEVAPAGGFDASNVRNIVGVNGIGELRFPDGSYFTPGTWLPEEIQYTRLVSTNTVEDIITLNAPPPQGLYLCAIRKLGAMRSDSAGAGRRVLTVTATGGAPPVILILVLEFGGALLRGTEEVLELSDDVMFQLFLGGGDVERDVISQPAGGIGGTTITISEADAILDRDQSALFAPYSVVNIDGTIRMSVQTEDAVTARLLFDPDEATTFFRLGDSAIYRFTGAVVGRKTDGTKFGAYDIDRTVSVQGGVVTSLASADAVVFETDAAWSCVSFANAVDVSLDINVTGALGDTVDWTSNIRVTELKPG